MSLRVHENGCEEKDQPLSDNREWAWAFLERCRRQAEAKANWDSIILTFLLRMEYPNAVIYTPSHSN